MTVIKFDKCIKTSKGRVSTAICFWHFDISEAIRFFQCFKCNIMETTCEIILP